MAKGEPNIATRTSYIQCHSYLCNLHDEMLVIIVHDDTNYLFTVKVSYLVNIYTVHASVIKKLCQINLDGGIFIRHNINKTIAN